MILIAGTPDFIERERTRGSEMDESENPDSVLWDIENSVQLNLREK